MMRWYILHGALVIGVLAVVANIVMLIRTDLLWRKVKRMEREQEPGKQ